MFKQRCCGTVMFALLTLPTMTAVVKARPMYEAVRQSAKRILLQNSRLDVPSGKRWTMPSRTLYPHQWAWDSAFVAMGFAEFDVPRGVTEVATLLRAQWQDGRVPHIVFHQDSDGYFPDAHYYGTAGRQNSSTFSQPPIWARALRMLYQKDPQAVSPQVWRELTLRTEKSHLWFYQDRDPLQLDCIGVAHPWESGMDNSPAWDVALARVDGKKAKPFVRKDRDKVKDAQSERPSDAQYAKYASLVSQVAVSPSFAPSPEFFVYDPFMTALLARSELDLAQLAVQLGEYDLAEAARERSQRLTAGLEKYLWDAHAGRFAFYDVVAERKFLPEVVASYLPVIAPHLTDAMRQQTVNSLEQSGYLNAPFGIPSVPPDHASFEASKYWRGPAWINVNYLLFDFLPPHDQVKLRQDSLHMAADAQSMFFEYYSPLDGRGIGASHFSWTAALVLHWLAK
ncbi:MAG: trehalase family glycosidase [Zetaproteobacteria bacterium]|nr:trehalase family glycosidase [Zetaproteobacteria bacterium]